MQRLVFFVLLCVGSLQAYEYERHDHGLFASYHVLIVDPDEHPIMAVKAEGLTHVLRLVSKESGEAGVNGGFFHKDGRAAGILRIEDLWYGQATKLRAAIGWADDGREVIIDRVICDEDEILPEQTEPEEWDFMEYIVGGTPLLVRDGLLIEDYSIERTLESFLTERHARTAIGIRADGSWVFVVVEMPARLFGGMTIRELAELMLELGCIDALNLDGGSSSTLVLGEDNIYGDRQVGDAIVILPAAK